MSPKSLASKSFASGAHAATLMMGLLVSGFVLAVMLRVTIGGPGPAHSPIAGLVFAAVLVGLCLAAGLSTLFSWRAVGIGIAGGCLLLAVPLLERVVLPGGAHPAGNYASWAIVVSCVALAEEAFLRGALFDIVTKTRGTYVAIVLTAVLFVILHIPLYGWHIVPLDFVVGIWLGVLKLTARSWIAPGIAHTLADLGGWWLV